MESLPWDEDTLHFAVSLRTPSRATHRPSTRIRSIWFLIPETPTSWHDAIQKGVLSFMQMTKQAWKTNIKLIQKLWKTEIEDEWPTEWRTSIYWTTQSFDIFVVGARTSRIYLLVAGWSCRKNVIWSQIANNAMLKQNTAKQKNLKIDER